MSQFSFRWRVEENDVAMQKASNESSLLKLFSILVCDNEEIFFLIINIKKKYF